MVVTENYLRSMLLFWSTCRVTVESTVVKSNLSRNYCFELVYLHFSYSAILNLRCRIDNMLGFCNIRPENDSVIIKMCCLDLIHFCTGNRNWMLGPTTGSCSRFGDTFLKLLLSVAWKFLLIRIFLFNFQNFAYLRRNMRSFLDTWSIKKTAEIWIHFFTLRVCRSTSARPAGRQSQQQRTPQAHHTETRINLLPETLN